MIAVVVYASSNGSTRGIAERIVTRLRLRHLAAVAREVSEDLEIRGVDAVVVGSAVHGGKWLPEASHFVFTNAKALRQRSTWFFSVSTVGDEESMFPSFVANRLRALRKETGEMRSLREAAAARGNRNFAGAIAADDWPVLGRAFFRALGGRYGDHRNWRAIDTYADGIATELLAQAPRAERVAN